MKHACPSRFSHQTAIEPNSTSHNQPFLVLLQQPVLLSLQNPSYACFPAPLNLNIHQVKSSKIHNIYWPSPFHSAKFKALKRQPIPITNYEKTSLCYCTGPGDCTGNIMKIIQMLLVLFFGNVAGNIPMFDPPKPILINHNKYLKRELCYNTTGPVKS